jgi:hypothetical protein
MDTVADDILDLQRGFDDAELRGDAERLDGLLADDFLSIGEHGYQLGKKEWIGRHGEFRYLSIETTEVDVRRYDKTAIVRCVQRSRATWRGEPMALAVRLSQVWTGGRGMAACRDPVQHPWLRLNRLVAPALPDRPPHADHSAEPKTGLLKFRIADYVSRSQRQAYCG